MCMLSQPRQLECCVAATAAAGKGAGAKRYKRRAPGSDAAGQGCAAQNDSYQPYLLNPQAPQPELLLPIFNALLFFGPFSVI
jgi:hypothetical protein